jgi:hypothetical protein
LVPGTICLATTPRPALKLCGSPGAGTACSPLLPGARAARGSAGAGPGLRRQEAPLRGARLGSAGGRGAAVRRPPRQRWRPLHPPARAQAASAARCALPLRRRACCQAPAVAVPPTAGPCCSRPRHATSCRKPIRVLSVLLRKAWMRAPRRRRRAQAGGPARLFRRRCWLRLFRRPRLAALLLGPAPAGGGGAARLTGCSWQACRRLLGVISPRLTLKRQLPSRPPRPTRAGARWLWGCCSRRGRACCRLGPAAPS